MGTVLHRRRRLILVLLQSRSWLSRFVAHYLRAKKLSPAKFKSQLKTNAHSKFCKFLEGDLGVKLAEILSCAKKDGTALHAASLRPQAAFHPS
jgi:hypothetical protein